MGKNKKGKHKQRQPLPVAKNNDIVSPKVTRPVMAPPIQAPMAKPVEIEDDFEITVPTSPKSAVVAPVAAPKQEDSKLLEGVVLGVHLYKDGKPIFARIRANNGEIYTAHRSTSQVPAEGTIVKFEPFTFERTKAAKVVSVGGVDPMIVKRLDFLKKQPIYVLMQPSDYLGMAGADIELPSIVGRTIEGMIVFYHADPPA